jgi:hypothetical protein
MVKVLVVLAPLVLAIYCLVQVAQSGQARVRALPRWAWALLIVVVPLLGSLGWLLLGRPSAAGPPRRGDRPAPRRPVAPDDDPDFLRRLRFDKPDEPR